MAMAAAGKQRASPPAATSSGDRRRPRTSGRADQYNFFHVWSSFAGTACAALVNGSDGIFFVEGKRRTRRERMFFSSHFVSEAESGRMKIRHEHVELPSYRKALHTPPFPSFLPSKRQEPVSAQASQLINIVVVKRWTR